MLDLLSPLPDALRPLQPILTRKPRKTQTRKIVRIRDTPLEEARGANPIARRTDHGG